MRKGQERQTQQTLSPALAGPRADWGPGSSTHSSSGVGTVFRVGWGPQPQSQMSFLRDLCSLSPASNPTIHIPQVGQHRVGTLSGGHSLFWGVPLGRIEGLGQQGWR